MDTWRRPLTPTEDWLWLLTVTVTVVVDWAAAGRALTRNAAREPTSSACRHVFTFCFDVTRSFSLHHENVRFSSFARRYALLVLCSPLAWAGFCSVDHSGDTRHDFQFFAGYSPVTATLIGTTTDRRFVLAGFGYSYRCWVWPKVSIAYTGEILPAAILLEPGQYLPQYVPA